VLNNFAYYTPTKVFFGKDEELNVGKIIKEYCPKKVLVHYGKNSAKKSGLLDKITSCLDKENIKYVLLGGVVANPELSLVREGIELCKKENVDFVLAVGGGSVIDSAKDIANGVANPDIDVWDFSLGISKPLKTLKKGAVLTLSAAGSEMSNSCVITNSETGEKRGYGSDLNRLDFAIENPELTYSVGKYQTGCGAVDISMHTIERYFSVGDNTDVTDAVAEAVIREAFKSGKECFNNPDDYNARANMMWASSLAHNGLTGCGRDVALTVHQFEHEISGKYPHIAHGAGLAAVWSAFARYVYKANIDRWYRYAKNVWGVEEGGKEEAILKAVKMQEDYYVSIEMPIRLKPLGVKKEDLEELALKCTRNKTRVLSGYMTLDYDDVLAIYKNAYE